MLEFGRTSFSEFLNCILSNYVDYEIINTAFCTTEPSLPQVTKMFAFFSFSRLDPWIMECSYPKRAIHISILVQIAPMIFRGDGTRKFVVYKSIYALKWRETPVSSNYLHIYLRTFSFGYAEIPHVPTGGCVFWSSEAWRFGKNTSKCNNVARGRWKATLTSRMLLSLLVLMLVADRICTGGVSCPPNLYLSHIV